MKSVKETTIKVIVREEIKSTRQQFKIAPKKIEYEGVMVNPEMYLWMEFLTQHSANGKSDFRKLFYDCDCIFGKAVFQYRSYVMDDARYKFNGDMLDCIARYDRDLLKDIIEMIFGEPLNHFEEQLRIMKKNGWDWERLLDILNMDNRKYSRFFALISIDYEKRFGSKRL